MECLGSIGQEIIQEVQEEEVLEIWVHNKIMEYLDSLQLVQVVVHKHLLMFLQAFLLKIMIVKKRMMKKRKEMMMNMLMKRPMRKKGMNSQKMRKKLGMKDFMKMVSSIIEKLSVVLFTIFCIKNYEYIVLKLIKLFH